VWRQIYDSVAVDESSVHWLREAQQMGTVVFLPTHRSYVDFLLLSYVCFHYNCPLPHIAAGMRERRREKEPG
jgi:glycerol-3-phosphate O-acyltransferase